MAGASKRPSKEEIAKILDPEKIAKFINKDGQLNTETDYKSSSLEFYLGKDSWLWEEALLILCGIQPLRVKYVYDDEGLVKIHHAVFLGRPNIYDVPSDDDVYRWSDECNEELQTCLSTNDSSRLNELKELNDELETYLDLLDHGYIRSVWEIRSNHAKRLTRYREWWKSGVHEDRNPPGYYIDWILKKGFEIPWLEWAKREGLLSTEIYDSNSLAVFRAMKNLFAEEISFSIKHGRLRVDISAREKSSAVSMREFKLINNKRDRLLKTGEVFLAIGRNEYDYDPNDRNHSRMARNIKEALGLIDNPFTNGKPSFKIRVSEDETAKFTATKTAISFEDWNTSEDYDPSSNISNL